ncbi:Peptidase inhibitor I78 family protein [compost metagenome]
MNNEQVLQALSHLLGTPYSASVKATVMQLSGRQRVVGAGELSTKEFDINRIHIIADAGGVITGFSFC